MVWVCFVGATKGPLNETAFIDKVYEPTILLFLNLVSNSPYIQGNKHTAMLEDGAPINTTQLSKKWFQENASAKLPWPEYSLDVNPMENI
ncbi:hypothetical protein O181_099850 [Austropuccinia psidii MF-1]|uniref:Uncharacterized protein n=1 Tax=Austropuccinia psidii MF-1 TaxID=1389203 RepID=A0A9Q3PG98_9BASI|nr:hypothetical protein [Austropuccinia psidii MF-1]